MRFRPGQLVRINPDHPQIQDADLYGDRIASFRCVPLIDDPQPLTNWGSWNCLPTDTVGIVIKTELDEEELVGLKRVGYYPLVQQMIVALMGESLIYVESAMLEDLEEE